MSTVKQLPNGKYDVQDADGNSLSVKFGGPFYTQGAADSASRMLNMFDTVEGQIAEINDELRAEDQDRKGVSRSAR